MPARSHLNSINLLPTDGYGSGLVARILRWVLTVGRVFVVLTELVVILAFLSRFWFDKKLNDIQEENSQRAAIVKSYSEVELQVRDILTRQKPIAEHVNSKTGPLLLFENLKSVIPQGVLLSDLSIDQGKISMTGSCSGEQSLSRMLSRLKGMKFFSRLTLDEVSYDQKQALVLFKVTGLIQENAE